MYLSAYLRREASIIVFCSCQSFVNFIKRYRPINKASYILGNHELCSYIGLMKEVFPTLSIRPFSSEIPNLKISLSQYSTFSFPSQCQILHHTLKTLFMGLKFYQSLLLDTHLQVLFLFQMTTILCIPLVNQRLTN